MVRWEEGGRRLDMGVGEVGGRCLPMWERRIEEGGAEVRRERRWWRVGRVVSEGMVRGIAGGFWLVGVFFGWDRGRGEVLSPERSLTNIWKFSGGVDGDVEEEEDEVDEERERTMVVGMELVACGYSDDGFLAYECRLALGGVESINGCQQLERWERLIGCRRKVDKMGYG